MQELLIVNWRAWFPSLTLSHPKVRSSVSHSKFMAFRFIASIKKGIATSDLNLPLFYSQRLGILWRQKWTISSKSCKKKKKSEMPINFIPHFFSNFYHENTFYHSRVILTRRLKSFRWLLNGIAICLPWKNIKEYKKG